MYCSFKQQDLKKKHCMLKFTMVEWGKPWLYIYSGSHTVCVYASMVTGLGPRCTLCSKKTTCESRVNWKQHHSRVFLSQQAAAASGCRPTGYTVTPIRVWSLWGSVGKWLVWHINAHNPSPVVNFCTAVSVIGEVSVAAEHLWENHSEFHTWKPVSQSWDS